MSQLNNLFDQTKHPEIQKLIGKFNETPEKNDLERIFYLQKINFLLKHTASDADLARWISANSREKGSWQAILTSYEINPLADPLLQTTQFANVVANSAERPAARTEESAQKLTEELNQLLKQNLPFERCQTQFVELNYRISQIFAQLANPYNRFARVKLKVFIDQFNALPQDDHIQRIFQLQRIQYQLNKVALNEEVFNWRNDHPNRTGTWESLLATYGIDPDGSFLLKSAQFAKAIKSRMKSYPPLPKDAAYNNVHKLMQQRDVLLEKDKLEENDKTLYIALCCRIDYLMENQPKNKGNKERHQSDLAIAKDKLSAIKGHNKEVSEKYKTAALGGHHANNFNFTLDIKVLQEELDKEVATEGVGTGGAQKEESKRFILRIEDRPQLSIEQKLHSYEVTDYFADDVAFWMVQVKENNAITYKPMVLSQFANEGDMRSVAKRLKDKNTGVVLSTARHFFQRINDFCLKLKEAGVYHPDIKLSNFLVHNKRLIVADRKTFVSGSTQFACDLRSTPQYAPQEYSDCLNEDQNDFLDIAETTSFDMEQFMAFQVGMALKEFLLLARTDELPEDYWSPDCDIESYFKDANPQLKNYILLIREMTRAEEGKRLSISQMQQLLHTVNKQPLNFYEDVEKILPSASVGLEKEYNEIQALLDNKLSNEELLKQANSIFIQLTSRDPQECRLNRFAEKLAVKCYEQCSKTYFSNISKSIENTLLEQDWPHASLTQKFIHYISFGYFRVPEVTDVTKIKIALDFSEPEFQSHFVPFIYLSESHLQHLGAKKSQHLMQYLKANKEEIRTAFTATRTENTLPDGLTEVEPSQNEQLKPQHDIHLNSEEDALSGDESLSGDELSSAEESSIAASVVIHNTDAGDSFLSSIVIGKSDETVGSDTSLPSSIVINQSQAQDEEAETEDLSGSIVIKPSANEQKIERQASRNASLSFFAAVKKEQSTSYLSRKRNRFFNKDSLRGPGSIVLRGEALHSLMAALSVEEDTASSVQAQNSLVVN
jgi:serine/threonine protein kinase